MGRKPTYSERGVVRVGGKGERGGEATAKRQGFLPIDVTSGSRKKLDEVKVSSIAPENLGPVTDDDGNTFKLFINSFAKASICSK